MSKAYETVTNCMLHGPCGPSYPKAPCWDNDKQECCKGFPKQYIEVTKQNQNGYPLYQRSSKGLTIKKNVFDFDNSRVTPYNLYLLTKYNAHINVEICSSVTAVKYLFKYVYKGHDRVKFGFSENNKDESLDEIKNYLDARFVSASEAAWRILGLPMSGQYPKTTRLTIHLENKQSIVFKEQASAESIMENSEKTMLTEYFEINKSEPSLKDVLYHNMPKHCSWSTKTKSWKLRK